MNIITDKKIIPTLRFSTFKNDWVIKLYGDIYSFHSNNSFSRANLNYKKGKAFNIHYGDIHTKFSAIFDISKELVPLINDDINLEKYGDESYCQVGDLVVADASEDYKDVGKTIELYKLDNKQVLAGLHTFLARPNKFKMALGFAGFLMQSWGVKKQVMTIAQGSKVLGISKKRLAKVKLVIPDYNEQQKIANFFIIIDEKLNQLSKKKKLLEDYKKASISKIFSQELRFQDKYGNNYPDWENKKLGEVGLFKSGIGFSFSEQGGKKGIPFLKVSDMNLVGNEFSISSANNYVSSEQIARLKYKVIEKESIIFAKVGAAVFLERKRIASDFLIDNNMMSFTPSDDIYFYKYLFETIRLSKYVQLGALPSYNASDLKTIKIKIPKSNLELNKIVDFLLSIDNKIDLVNTQIEKTKAFKKGLLQQMFV